MNLRGFALRRHLSAPYIDKFLWRDGNTVDFDKLVHVIQHGLQGLQVKISKISQQRQTILIILCISESMALIISNIAIVFTNLIP